MGHVSHTMNLPLSIARMLVCLAVGAMTTVAVAWAFALAQVNVGAPEVEAYTVSAGLYRSVFVAHATGAAEITFHHIHNRTEGRDAHRFERFKHDEIDVSDVTPGWLVALEQRRTDQQADIAVSTFVYAFGWPRPAMYYTSVVYAPVNSGSTAPPDEPYRGAWMVQREYPQKHLPLIPIWRNIAIDAVVYALCWGALWTACTRTRRAIRRMRSRCPVCTYHLHPACTPGCPECGWCRND